EVAATMTEMFAGLPPQHEFFEQFSFIDANQLPEFAAILTVIENGGLQALDDQQRDRLLSLPFKLIAARHRLGVLDERMQQRILEARRAFREDLPEAARDQIEFFDPARYNAATAALDEPAQTMAMAGWRREMAGRGLIWVLHRASLARNFDRVLVMSAGKLQEQGRFEELDRKDSLTALLMAAE